MIGRMAARMVITYSVEKAYILEHKASKSSTLHDKYRHTKPVYRREMAGADGLYSLVGTIGTLKSSP